VASGLIMENVRSIAISVSSLELIEEVWAAQ
jgi:hypothetical protein